MFSSTNYCIILCHKIKLVYLWLNYGLACIFQSKVVDRRHSIWYFRQVPPFAAANGLDNPP